MSDWTARSILDVCAKVSSGGTPSRKQPEYYVDGTHYWVKSQELIDGPIYGTDEQITDEALANSSAKLYPPDTVLMAMYGATVGKLGLLRCQSSVNQAICAMVTDEDIAHYRYLYYALLVHREELTAKAHGAAQQNLNQSLIKSFELPFPPVEMQRRIAGILSAYDNLIETNTRRIRVLEEMARVLYREWFVHYRFPGYEDAAMVEHADLGEVPEGWEVSRLGAIAKEVRRGVDPAKLEDDTPYIGLGHMPKKSVGLSEWGRADEVTSTKLAFRRGEILFGKIRPYFHKVGVAPLDGVSSTDAIIIVPKGDYYFGYTLALVSSEPFVEHATTTSSGTKMPRANWNVLTKYPAVLPGYQLLSRFDEIVRAKVELIINLIHKNNNLRQTRDLLLPRLVSGELSAEAAEAELEAVA